MPKSEVELRHLYYFVAVAEELNITRAAKRLHTVQPSLSRQIHDLEELLGASLLIRSGHALELTDAGRMLLRESKRILKSVESTLTRVKRVAHTECGRLTVGLIHGADLRIFPKLVPLLHSSCPKMQLSLRTLNDMEQVMALRSGEIDVGFVRSYMEDPRIASEVILSDHIVAAVSAKHPIAKLRQVPLPVLTALPWVTLKRTVGSALFDEALSIAAQAQVDLQPIIETDNILTTLSAVGAGMGFSLVPDYLREILPHGVVLRPLTIAPAPTLDLLVVYRKGKRQSGVQAFLAMLRECFQAEKNQGVGSASAAGH